DAAAARAHLAGVLNENDDEQLAVAEDTDDKVLNVALPGALGGIGLRFVEAELHPAEHVPSGIPRALPGFSLAPGPLATTPCVPGGVVSIDHAAVNVNDVPSVRDRLARVTGWRFFRRFDQDSLQRPLSATTIQSPTTEGLLTIVQPTHKSSIFE